MLRNIICMRTMMRNRVVRRCRRKIRIGLYEYTVTSDFYCCHHVLNRIIKKVSEKMQII